MHAHAVTFSLNFSSPTSSSDNTAPQPMTVNSLSRTMVTCFLATMQKDSVNVSPSLITEICKLSLKRNLFCELSSLQRNACLYIKPLSHFFDVSWLVCHECLSLQIIVTFSHHCLFTYSSLYLVSLSFMCLLVLFIVPPLCLRLHYSQNEVQCSISLFYISFTSCFCTINKITIIQKYRKLTSILKMTLPLFPY